MKLNIKHRKSCLNLFSILASSKSILCVFRGAEPLSLQFTSEQSGKVNSKEELLCLEAFLPFQLHHLV